MAPTFPRFPTFYSVFTPAPAWQNSRQKKKKKELSCETPSLDKGTVAHLGSQCHPNKCNRKDSHSSSGGSFPHVPVHLGDFTQLSQKEAAEAMPIPCHR